LTLSAALSRISNKKITEEFGDNFKYLNEAVGQLLTWQKQYKSHVETTAARHDEIVHSMKDATQNFSLLSGEASSFSKTASDLSSLMSILESQKHTLQKSLESLGNLLTAASGSLPEIQAKIVEIAQQLSIAAKQSQKIMTDAIAENTTTLKRAIESSAEDSTKSHQVQMKQLGEIIGKTKEQVATLDAALTEELQKSLEGLGRQLSALSEKFVNDYTPLTDRLKRVVEMARALE
jgi:chromosome segregation ATPase